jgi:hypothetical protein
MQRQSKYNREAMTTYLVMFVSQQKITPIFDVFIEVELVPAVLVNGSKYKESYVEELLSRFTVIKALRD